MTDTRRSVWPNCRYSIRVSSPLRGASGGSHTRKYQCRLPSMSTDSSSTKRRAGFFCEREHPTEGPIVTFASPLDFDKTKTGFRRHAPRLGQDGVEVLRGAGLSAGSAL